mmetsp:Transcript_18899/g.30893  ORF Transcript_18899/g.30893 Transcript_18899/m.30893 type:complete len:243 (-) Transcript_18899:1155-1883(-)|eukprot:CAMPEP_0203753750 /NCGR_PEP_ID=MMETSP0098-20131031/7469_1 /ASSEMBLY_ACC=CAM_ASM_000208 /TAXON_ID=96639 /ORGANISM=" , Strain NY0313808BC1" /LENGTH=242 /DNA_ID=CAMNT_0050644485 /DNA_START=614 /DNA_END=1342 /DNA_ORIENTATION=+
MTGNDEGVVLHYWEIQGIGAPCRMALEYAGVKYKEEFARRETWFSSVKVGLQADNPLAGLPCVEFVKNGQRVVVSESHAVLLELGRRYLNDGHTEEELCRNEQVQFCVAEKFWTYIRLIYPFHTPVERFPEETDKYLDAQGLGSVHECFSKLEQCLGLWGTYFFGGSRPLSSDFLAYQVLRFHRELGHHRSKDLVGRFPLLVKFMERIEHLDQLSSYFKSGGGKLVLNARFASFNKVYEDKE